MRIAVLTNDYPPESRGGAGIIAEIQVRELLRRGHEVKVFTSAPAWTDKSLFVRLFHHLNDLKANRKLVVEIVEWKPQILLTHNLTGCGIGTPRMVKHHGIPWIHVLHDVQLVDPSGRIVKGESCFVLRTLWRWKWSVMRRWTLGNPNVVVSPTEWLLKFHRKWGFFNASKSKVIGNPMPVEGRILDSRLRGNDKQVLFVGRLEHDKGFDVLLGAWKSLGPEAPRLSVVGDGKGRSRLESMKDERISILGALPHERVLELMRSHAVLAVPSLLIENQPTVILEGLASGCDVVASDVGGIPETLDGAGFVVKAGDVNALASSLKIAIDDTDAVARDEREKNRGKILSRHRVEVVVAELEFVLKSNL